MSTRRVASRTIGRYEIGPEIGRGGMATVYVARQLDLERQVALKELHTFRTFDPSFARRFLREARLAGSLSHPNIVTVHEYFEYDRVPYIAMEYLARGSLRPFIGHLTVAQTGGVLEGLLAGLAHAERYGVVHRDIKPENLLVTLEGGVKIADFGIAKATHALESTSSLTVVGTTVGTPNYIAPEQAMAGQLGPWTDLYSVGVTAFELLVGRTPFGDTEQPMGIVLRQINEPVPRVTDLVPEVDPWLSDWVAWLVSKAPADRPQTAAQAWDALEEALIGLLGPRWSRAAPLLAPQDLPAAPRGGRVSRRVTSPGATTPSKRTTLGPEDPRLAATIPPRARVVGAQAAATSAAGAGRRSRLPTAIKAASAAAVLIAVGAAVAHSALQGGSPVAARHPAQQTGSAPAPSLPAALDASGPRNDATRAQLASQVAPARELARTYEQSASSISRRAQGGASDRARLVAALRRTARAYRKAAAAAERGDLAGYSAALTDAAAGRRTVTAALDSSLQGGGSSSLPVQTLPAQTSTGSGSRARQPAPARAPAPPSPCAGDSSSDDPSDDECGN